MNTPAHSRTQSERSDQTRARILEAAVSHFSQFGMAGARTDRIAETAGVNKALLYYYFESKDKLYLAALERLATHVLEQCQQTLGAAASPGERIVRMALAHFDRILAQSDFQRLLHHEMIRLHKGEDSAMALIVEKVFNPQILDFRQQVQAGIASGELIDADWLQMHLTSIGPNVMYFLSSPLWQMALDFDPLLPSALTHRRRHLVEYLGQAIFVDREHGAQIAARVLADTPMPAFTSQNFFRGVRYERSK